jgi:hypothetical protein
MPFLPRSFLARFIFPGFLTFVPSRFQESYSDVFGRPMLPFQISYFRSGPVSENFEKWRDFVSFIFLPSSPSDGDFPVLWHSSSFPAFTFLCIPSSTWSLWRYTLSFPWCCLSKPDLSNVSHDRTHISNRMLI